MVKFSIECCNANGRKRFLALRVTYVWENLAQLVSHLPCNARVPSSNPSCTRVIFFFWPGWKSIHMT